MLYKESRFAMYTITAITVSSSSEEKAKKAIDAAFKELDRLEGLLNYYSADSEISLINRNAGIMPAKVSPETLEIIEKAIFVSENTDSAFDITMGPVIALWDFQKKTLPDKKMIKERLKQVGYKNIVINRVQSTATVFLKKKGIEINPGGIIKGYAADKAVEVLKKNGIEAGIVAIAGDIKAFGKRPDGQLWKVGIQNPRPKKSSEFRVRSSELKDEILATVDLSDMAISTSGDYERFFEKDGKRYHHIIDPKTGYPANECQSVTIVAKDGVFTDAFATAVFILGPQMGMEVLKKLGFDGVIADKNGKIHVTEGIKDRIEFTGTTEQQRSRTAVKN